MRGKMKPTRGQIDTERDLLSHQSENSLFDFCVREETVILSSFL